MATRTISKSKLNLSGIIVAIATPFQNTSHQSVDYEKLKENVAKWEKIPFAGKVTKNCNIRNHRFMPVLLLKGIVSADLTGNGLT